MILSLKYEQSVIGDLALLIIIASFINFSFILVVHVYMILNGVAEAHLPLHMDMIIPLLEDLMGTTNGIQIYLAVVQSLRCVSSAL